MKYTRLGILFLALLVTLALVGCAAAEDLIDLPPELTSSGDDAPDPEPEITPPQVEDPDDAVDFEIGFLRIGLPDYGYVTVPESWVDYNEQGSDDSAIRLSDPTGAAVIALDVVAEEGDVEEFMYVLSVQLEEFGGQDVTPAITPLGDVARVYQLSCLFEDQGVVMMAWGFADEEGRIHLITAEAPAEGILEVVTYIDESFSLTE